MTRQEAIKGLKVLAKDFSGYKPNEEMFDMAIEALEKQIPKKPDLISDGYADGNYVWEPYCPNCCHNLEDDGEPDYCPNCGQYIDWEEDET